MADRQAPTITGARVHYGFPTVWVEPYRTTTRYGDEVEVHEFYLDGSFVSVEGRKIRKNGTPYARGCSLSGVTVPKEIMEILTNLKEKGDG